MNNSILAYAAYILFLGILSQLVWVAYQYIMHRRIEVYLVSQAPGEPLPSPTEVSALIEEGRRVGLTRSRFTTQREFLLGWGIREEMEAQRTSRFGAADTARHTDQGQADLLRAYSLRNAVNALLDPSGLGGFRVLIQRKERRQ